MRRLVKKFIPRIIFERIEPFGHLLEAVFAQIIYGFPARKMKVIGVTGTDGKTTTATLISSILKSAGYKTGMMTTISIDFGEGAEPNPTRLTTVSAMTLAKLIKRMKMNGAEWLVLETTSHALAQNRVWGIPFHLAVMTNVTHEHLDYHKTFERYRDSKLKLFKLTASNKDGLRTGIVNADDASAELFIKSVPRALTFGEKGKIKAKNVISSPSGSSFEVSYVSRVEGGFDAFVYDLKINSAIPGTFNVSNILAAIAAGFALSVDYKMIEEGISNLKSVEGRMNAVDLGQDFTVIVDYAHTPESFEKIFSELKPLTEGKLICVFGSAGERDREKRTIQGEITGRMCDIVVVTEEDDRTEDGNKIMEEIASGAKKSGKTLENDLFLIHDRSDAIKFGVQKAEAKDTVVSLGKGHEKSIIGREGKREWDEIKAVEEALKERTDEGK